MSEKTEDRFDGKTIAEFENDSLIKHNEEIEANLDREARMHRHFYWRGNKLPPFSIEHMPYERQRLEVEMTPEDRRLRKQWLDDQILAPNEPIYVPALYPRNPFRKFFGKPWDVVFNALKPIIGPQKAFTGRFWCPKVAIALIAIYGTYYHMKFNYARWHTIAGWHFYYAKPTTVHKYDKLPDMQYDDFNSREFKLRTCLREGRKSSSTPP